MAQFMLLLHSEMEREGDLSPAEMQAIIQRYKDWSTTVAEAGKLLGGDKLTDDPGKVMRARSGAVTDGPYSETKEIIGGYFMIEADDYDEACRVAESYPHLELGGTIEVRQVDL